MDTKILATWEQLTGHATIREQVETASLGKLPAHAPYLLDMAVGFYRERIEGILYASDSSLLLVGYASREAITGPADLDMEIDMSIPEIRNMVDEVHLEELIDNIAEADEAVHHGMDFLDSRYRTHVNRFNPVYFDINDEYSCVLAQATDMAWEDAVQSLGLQRWLPETAEKMIELGFMARTDEMEEIVSQLWLRAYAQRKA